MTESTKSPITAAGNWNEKKVKLIAKYPVLTDADLRYDEGKKDEMLNKVTAKIGTTREKLNEVLAAL